MKTFRKLAKISIVLVYLVIIAGAIVRMTGSGMGCPDWPKCFGYYIPPTDVETLEWKPERTFKKGQVIILNETLQVAKTDFVTASLFNPNNWEVYTKHNYSTFNVWHTWIEYVNRLFGALAGLATFILAIYSLKFWSKKKRITLISWLVVFGMGFQAWLGATVVYSVLEPVKITIHMIMALVIVALILYLIFEVHESNKLHKHQKPITRILISSLILTLIQIVLGTQVRQFVDEQIDIVGENAKELWLLKPTIQFYIHRSFSVLVVVFNGYLFYIIRKSSLGFEKINWVIGLILIEVLTGIIMYYLDFPFGSQPLHLVLASILFGVQFYLVLEALKASKSHKTLYL
ncbi:COX15/CtaA family protein [uncultured Croceitalea sp.]|uniref:COX15/CtaA family protein n=1 Tax=uncultured Croceitalea sp. TaxID=1798908 RepID=UPI003305F7C5